MQRTAQQARRWDDADSARDQPDQEADYSVRTLVECRPSELLAARSHHVEKSIHGVTGLLAAAPIQQPLGPTTNVGLPMAVENRS
jgi:hypothetical protein